MNEMEEIKTYQEFEKQFDTELEKQAESFIKVGYLLKIARDTEILKESGYKTVAEFAKERYGLTKDIVSRYIRINDRFSKNGYSEELEDQYKGFGYSKLAIMLTLPDSIIGALDPQMSKSGIEEVQKEVKEELEIPPLQVMMEEKKPEQTNLTDLQAFIHQYGYEHREQVNELAKAAEHEKYQEMILNILAPRGTAIIPIRIAGRGKLMLSLSGKEKPPVILNVREESNVEQSWECLRDDIRSLYKDGTDEIRKQSTIEEKGVEAEKEVKKIAQDVPTVFGSGGVEEPPITKVKAITEELKDKLFDIWFSNVSEDKIDSACKMMNNMKFTELINVTPKKLFLLVQTNEVTTSEVVKDGIQLTEVTTENYTGTFTSQEFQKRFNRKYLEPYKKKAADEVEEQKEKVAPVQQEESKEQQEEQILGQAVIEDYPEVLPKAADNTMKFIKDNSVDKQYLCDWYQNSVESTIWTDEHIEEMLSDFYAIPREIVDNSLANQ